MISVCHPMTRNLSMLFTEDFPSLLSSPIQPQGSASAFFIHTQFPFFYCTTPSHAFTKFAEWFLPPRFFLIEAESLLGGYTGRVPPYITV